MNKKLNSYFLNKRTDSRGWLLENAVPGFIREIKHFFIVETKPGSVRGNHYHHHKREWFVVLQGKAQVIFYDLKTKKKRRFVIKGQSKKFIETKPMIVHAIKNIGKEKLIMLAFVNEVFDIKNPDTYSRIILK